MSLCNTSKILIKSVIQIIIDGEQELELLKQHFLQYIINLRIDISQCFLYISRDSDVITLKLLADFFDCHLLKYTQDELSNLQTMDFQNFLYFILPASTHALKKMQIRKTQNQNEDQNPDSECTGLILKVYNAEIVLQRRITAYIEQIKERWDCKESQRLMGFLCPKQTNDQSLIISLFNSLAIDAEQESLVCLIRRLDKDLDFDVGYKDWDMFFNPHKYANKLKNKKSSRPLKSQEHINRSTLSSSRNIINSARKDKSLREINKTLKSSLKSSTSQRRVSSSTNQILPRQQSTKIYSIPRDELGKSCISKSNNDFNNSKSKISKSNDEFSGLNNIIKSRNDTSKSRNNTHQNSSSGQIYEDSNTRRNHISSIQQSAKYSNQPVYHTFHEPDQKTIPLQMKQQQQQYQQQQFYDHNDFLNLMKVMSMQVEDQEAIKNELALQNDFTIQDTFLFLDLNVDGFVDHEDLRISIHEFGLDLDPFMIQLIWQFLGLRDQQMDYNDIHKLLIPKTESFAKIISSRPMQNRRVGDVLAFSNMTRALLCQFLRCTIDSQNKLNGIKNTQKIKSKYSNYMDAIFKYMDGDEDGVLFLEDLSIYKKHLFGEVNFPLVFQKLIKNQNYQQDSIIETKESQVLKIQMIIYIIDCQILQILMNNDDWYTEDPDADKRIAEREIVSLTELSVSQGFREGILQESDVIEERLKESGFKAGYNEGYSKGEQEAAIALLKMVAKNHKVNLETELKNLENTQDFNSELNKVLENINAFIF